MVKDIVSKADRENQDFMITKKATNQQTGFGDFYNNVTKLEPPRDFTPSLPPTQQTTATLQSQDRRPSQGRLLPSAQSNS